MMWLFAGVPDDPHDDTVMEKQRADALYSAVKNLMHAIQTEDEEAQQDAAHQMIQISKPCTMRMWSESKLTNRQPLNADTEGDCTPNLSWVDRGRASKTEGPGREILFTECFGSMAGSSIAASMCFVGVGRHRGLQQRCWTIVQWMPTRYLGGLADFPMAERDISANACQRTCRVSRTWRRQRNKWATLSGTCESWKCSSSASPSQKAVLFCPLPGRVHHLKWWWTKYFADHVDIFDMYAEMGNDERTEMKLELKDSPDPSVFVTTPKVGRTGLNLITGNHALITQKVLGIEQAVAGTCTSRQVRAKQSTTHMVTEYGSWLLW